MIKKILIAVVLFFLFIDPAECESPVPQTESIYFYPVADTYVYEKSNAAPLSKMELLVGNQNTINFGNMRSVLKFDISAIPENSVITEARLNVYSFDTRPSWDYRPIQAYAAPQNWSESGIDWSLTSDENAKLHDSSLIAGIAGSSPDAYYWDITNIVQSWVNGEPNFGIVLQYYFENFNEYITIYSSKNLIFKPYLNVSYSLPDPPSKGRSLPAETIKKRNDLSINESAVVENNVKTIKAEEPGSQTSIQHVDPALLIDPIILNDTQSDQVQTPLQIILPEITRHPQLQYKNPGSPVNFLVTAKGTPPLFFQWQKDGKNIEDEISKILTIQSTSADDEGIYTCTVSNDAGSTVSNGAELCINDAAEIVEHPASRSIVLGKPVIFSLTAAGTGPLSYQWKKDHIIIQGATTDLYTITSVQKKDEGVYTCEVSNDFSNDISNDALLVVITPPQITKQPLSQIKNPGIPVTFSVIPYGTSPFSFQWLKDGTAIDGETSKSLTIGSVSKNDEGVFTCTVSNDAGSLTSNPAVLTVNDSVNIIKQPLSLSKSAGESVTFSVEAAGTEPLSFQWEKNGLDISGATSKSYTIPSVQNADGGAYKCRVNNDFSHIISNRADLLLKNSAQISRHPQSQSKNPGMPVTFSVTATGTPPFFFQWQKNGVDINGATSEGFTIDSVSENDEGFYSCTVSNDAGSVRSDDAELLVNDPVQIKVHPLSQSKKTGETAIFSITPAGADPWSFQWKKNHIVIPGATSKTYTIDAAIKEDEGIYTCLISNDFSNDISYEATLVLINPPQIIQQPLSMAINPGAPATFEVTASGTHPVSYQWMKNGSPIANADTDKYFIASVSKEDEGTFTCLIANDAGSLASNPAVLTVNDSVRIIQQPLSFSKNPGESVTFSVEAVGTDPLSFQWEKNGLDISGATSKSYTIPSVQNADGGAYKCRVSNDFSYIISESIHLILNNVAQIIQHPQSQLKSHGMPVSFSVTASGTPPLFFQWQKDGMDINGATSEDLTIDSVSENDEGFYACKVSNSAGSVTSADAELMINLPPQIKQHPESQLVNPGLPVTFSVIATGVPPLSFQWRKDFVDIDGATSADFTIDSIAEIDKGFYSCRVSNSAGNVTSKDAELFLNVFTAKDSDGSAPEPAKTNNTLIQQNEPIVTAAPHPHQSIKTITPRLPASTGSSEKKESAITGFKKQSQFTFKRLFIEPPAGQGLYAHNGDTLTCKGIAFPQATLVSATLEDEQGRSIRDVSKGLKIDRETGNISGSVFVGSFRGAETVHLKISIQGPSDNQVATGISNTLFMDNTYPTVQVTEPANHKNFDSSPIVIYGTAYDDISGIAAVEISTDGGSTYCSVDIIRNNQWLYSFTPKSPNTDYKIKVRSTDGVGLSTESDYLTIHYNASAAPVREVNKTPMRKSPDKINDKSDKSPDDDGIYTYRIISLSNNNFQPTDVFTLKEQMAIIVKGYGGNMVTLRIIDPSIGKILFELSDFIPPHRNKMWKWKLSQTGKFQATLFVDDILQDDIFFTIIQ